MGSAEGCNNKDILILRSCKGKVEGKDLIRGLRPMTVVDGPSQSG